MKKHFVFICAVALLLCSCSRIPDTYSFPNRMESIVSVEFFHNMNPGGFGVDGSNMVMLYSLNEKEMTDFMDALYALPTERVGTPPPWGYGRYVVKVSYKNGDVEMYGSSNMEFIQAGEQTWGVDDYCFTSRADFEALFAKYADIHNLPDPPPLD